MKFIFALSLVVLMGCNSSKPVERYFYVSYEVTSSDRNTKDVGDFWFKWNGFPRMQDIDSLTYDVLSKKKECYQPVLITFLFEFKSKEDFEAFGTGYKGSLHPGQSKSECCEICPDSIIWGGVLLGVDSQGTVSKIPMDSLTFKAQGMHR